MSFDEAARDRLVAKITRLNGGLALRAPLPAVPVREFMDDNDDRDSIAVNVLESQDAFRELRKHLLALESEPGVIAVLVEIHEIEEGAWPFTERVYVVAADGEKERLLRLFEALRPSDVGEGWFDGKPPGAPELRFSDRVFSLWWD